MARVPTVSVLMPNYNHGRYIEAALEALLRQSVPADEIFVIDDASTDDSVEVIERCIRKHPSVRLVRNPANVGVNASVMRGFEHCTGDFVLCAAADDMVLPGFFETALTFLADHPEAGICCSDAMVVHPGSRQALTYPFLVGCDSPRFLTPAEFIRLQRGKDMNCPTCATLFNRSAMLEAGGMMADLKWHPDYFLFYTLGFRYGVCYFPGRFFSAFRANPQSYGSVRPRKEEADVAQRIFDLLLSERYRDVMPAFRDTGILYHLRQPLLDACARDPKYALFATPGVRRRVRYLAMRRLMARALAFSPEAKLVLERMRLAVRRGLGMRGHAGSAIPPDLNAEIERMFV